MPDKTDFITKSKNLIKKIYANKYFKLAVFAVFMVIVLREYSDITNTVKFNSKNKNNQEKPIVINRVDALKSATSSVFSKANNQERIREENRKIAERREKAAQEQQKQLKAIEELKKEFAIKSGKQKRIVKYGDNTTLKMILTNGEYFDIPMQPITMEIKMTKEKENIFAKFVVGKRVDDVIAVPIKVFMDLTNIKKNVEKLEKDSGISNVGFDYSAVESSPMIYRIKIVDTK